MYSYQRNMSRTFRKIIFNATNQNYALDNSWSIT
jgi:hypothetical protein